MIRYILIALLAAGLPCAHMTESAVSQQAMVQTQKAIGEIDFSGIEIPIWLPELPPFEKHYVMSELQGSAYTLTFYNNPERNSLCFSESCYQGEISGKIEETAENFSLPDAAGLQEEVLIPGLIAYTEDEKTQVCWLQDGWIFDYTGHSGNWERLKALALKWEKCLPPVSSGYVQISVGSSCYMSVAWKSEGCQYTFTARNADWNAVVDTVVSFRKVTFLP